MYDSFSDIPKFLKANYNTEVTFRGLKKMVDYFESEYNMDMNPDFQRGHVWTTKQQQKYVEFCLRGGESAKDIYFNCHGFSSGVGTKMVLVDGKQRLTAVLAFMNNQLRAFGKLLTEYNEPVPPLLSLRFNVNELKTKAEVLQWYLDMNDGGVAHSQEEISRVRALLATCISAKT